MKRLHSTRLAALSAALITALGLGAPSYLPAAPFSAAILNTSSDPNNLVETIPLEATVLVSPPTITIKTYAPGTFTIYRKDPSVNTWGTAVATGLTLSANATWSDTNVVVGTMYEYRFVNTAVVAYSGVQPSGYILTGIQVDQTLPKGRMAVVVASDLPTTLPTEYAQYKADLINDGWNVSEIQVPRAPNYNGLGNAGISAVTVTAGGTSSVGSGSAVHFTNASGKVAIGTLTTSGGAITRVGIPAGGEGTGFAVGDTLTVSGGSIAGTGGYFQAVVDGSSLGISSAYPVSGGSGYTDGDTVTLTGQTSGMSVQVTIDVYNGALNYFYIPTNTTGFINGEVLNLTGNSTGSGTGPLTAYVSNGNFTYVYIHAPGTGYTQGESATLTGVTSGKTAQVTLNVNSGYITGTTVISSQTGFTNGENLSISNTATGTGAGLFTGNFGGTLTGGTVYQAGTGYTNGALVTITYGGATAQGTLVASGGLLTGLNVTSSSAGFTSGGYLTLSALSTGYTLTVSTLDNAGTGRPVSVTGGGTGYVDNDVVTVKGGSSNQTAKGSIIAPSGSITGISIVLPNTFTVGESLTITPTLGGSGASASVGASSDLHLLIRSAIQQLYTAYPVDLKNIVMLGKVPVCRSGINDGAGSDGHGNECPYGADAFYADMDSVVGVDWTDTGDNLTSQYTNYNVPGDKQFDQQRITNIANGKVELGFGRVDLSLGINTEVEAMRNYFGKLHRYKTADPSFRPGKIVCDRQSYANEREADLQAMPGVVGMSNISFITGSALPAVQAGQDADQLYTTQNGPFLFYFKGSGGPGGGVNGKAVFWTGMQSHWGYWFAAGLLSSGSNDMQLRLAENSFTLDFTWNIWGMRYIYHRMGMGLDAGDMLKQSINNQGQSSANGPYSYKFNNTSNGDYSGALYMDQMGDPALRLFMFTPPTALSVVKSGGNPVLTWTASTEPTVTGYHVYRAATASSAFTRLTAAPVATTTYTDTSVTSGSYVYMVRAVRLETTGGGTYYNASLGITQSTNLDIANPTLSITTASLPTVAWNTATSLTLTAQGGTPQYAWSITGGALPSGLTLSSLGVISGSTSLVGNFPVTVQAQDQLGQIATKALNVLISQNTANVIYPESTTYTLSAFPTNSYGTYETAEVLGPTSNAETFHRYNLSGVNAYNGISKATVYLYVTSNTTTNAISLMQANMIADSVNGWVANGLSKFFTGVSSGGAGKTNVNAPGHTFTTGAQITLAGLGGSGAPVGPYSITVVDADNFTIPVTYSAAWTYDPALSYATAASTNYNSRPTLYDTTVQTITGTGTNTPGSWLAFDVTSYVQRALTFPSKKMGIRFFTGTNQAVFTGTLNSFGNSVPYLVIQSANAPSIVVNAPTVNPVSINAGSGIYLSTTVTAIPAQAATLTVAWSQVSGPGVASFTNPNSASTGATFSSPGTYILRLTANDGAEVSTQDITVRVLGVPVAGPTDSLVLRLPFDEASGGTAFDASGVTPPNNGTLGATPAANPLPSFTAGKIGNALSFSATGQRVDVADSTTNKLDGAPQMAISLWFYSNGFQASASNYNAVICKRLAAFKNESYTMAIRGGNVNQGTMYWDMGAGSTSGTVFAINKWYHVVMMFDGTTTTNNVQLWVNGNPDKFVSTSTQTTVTRNTASNVHIGAYDTADAIGWNGMIDEVRIYNRLLTPSEIMDLASAVPTNLGPVITTNTSLSGNAGQTLPLTATVTDDGKPNNTLTYNWSELSGPSTLNFTNPTTLTASTTPGIGGTYGLLFTASDGMVTTFANIGATITGAAPVTYSSWASGKGLTGNNALPTAILGNDGLNNLYKYALGLDPFTTYSPNDAGMPKVDTTPDKQNLRLSFNGVATDVTYRVQVSSDLATWTDLQVFPNGTAPGAVTVIDSSVVIGSTPKRFLRLYMTNP